MKKILSLTLAVLMLVSAVPMVHAAENNWEGGTTVTYTATGAEEWTVTVPATLAPGAAGDVTAAGTWGSNRKLVVTADDDVTLTNSINANDQKVLTVTFADIALVGDNTKSVSETKQVSVAAMPSDALFGTWSGTFYYDVEMVGNGSEEISVIINSVAYDNGITGMTWGEWLAAIEGTNIPYYNDMGVVKNSDTYEMVYVDNSTLVQLSDVIIPDYDYILR